MSPLKLSSNMLFPTTKSTNGAEVSLSTIEDVIEGASKVNAVPLWPQMVKYNPPAPNPKCVPHIWRYDQVRPYLVRAGELVKEKDAERRVLMLVNPERGMISVSVKRKRKSEEIYNYEDKY
jgi:gentisate 1,2-dioxygenase